MRQRRAEDLGLVRMFMVLSSFAPLFLLWAVKGSAVLSDFVLVTGCLVAAVVPTAVLWLRILVVKRRGDVTCLEVGTPEDHRSHVLTYLFATLLPFYGYEWANLRDLAATVVALAFTVLLFWRLNLHYTNVIFALLGYRVYTVHSPDDDNPFTGREPFVVIARRSRLVPAVKVEAYRLSNAVYLERR